MYAGHFAAGLALKARVPEAPTWGLLVGVGVLDILFGPFVLAGIERVSATPGVAPGFSLDHIDWSHSLAMSLVWSLLFGAAFLRRGRLVAVTMAAAVLSHFVLDLAMHPSDLALWPGSSIHLGFGLWRGHGRTGLSAVGPRQRLPWCSRCIWPILHGSLWREQRSLRLETGDPTPSI